MRAKIIWILFPVFHSSDLSVGVNICQMNQLLTHSAFITVTYKLVVFSGEYFKLPEGRGQALLTSEPPTALGTQQIVIGGSVNGFLDSLSTLVLYPLNILQPFVKYSVKGLLFPIDLLSKLGQTIKDLLNFITLKVATQQRGKQWHGRIWRDSQRVTLS